MSFFVQVDFILKKFILLLFGRYCLFLISETLYSPVHNKYMKLEKELYFTLTLLQGLELLLAHILGEEGDEGGYTAAGSVHHGLCVHME